MKTIALQIGNSDNKLTQQEWSDYVLQISNRIDHLSEARFFAAGSECSRPWQNYCWVFRVELSRIQTLRNQVMQIRAEFKQESVSWMEGDCEFI